MLAKLGGWAEFLVDLTNNSAHPCHATPRSRGWRATQHGVVTAGQLAAIGLSATAIGDRVTAGHIHRVHRGVYAVGHTAIGRHGRWPAAVLACGPRAALSHRDAAILGRLPGALREQVDVTTPSADAEPAPGSRYRVRDLAPEDVTTIAAIPITTIARTLVDLAEVLGDRELERVFHEAEVLGLLDAQAITGAASRVTGRRGLDRVYALLHTPSAPLRSDLERRFLALCHAAGLPRPQVNTTIHAAGRDSRSTSTGPPTTSSPRPTAPPPTPAAAPSKRTPPRHRPHHRRQARRALHLAARQRGAREVAATLAALLGSPR